jgi:hypothetical protein
MTGTIPPSPPLPSSRQLAIAAAAALSTAALILLVAVLPAEYGIDPLGAGRALGLMPPAGTAPDASPMPSADATLAPLTRGAVSYYGRPFAVDRFAVDLGPYEFIEYKYRLEEGASLHFAWEASAPVVQELHADPDGTDGHNPVSFDKRELTRASGTHTAPFPGMHGWYWENPGAEPVTVTLTSAGFFASAMEYRSTGTRISHEVSTLDSIGTPPPRPEAGDSAEPR